MRARLARGLGNRQAEDALAAQPVLTNVRYPSGASSYLRAIRVPAEDPASGYTTKSHRARAIPLSRAAGGWLEKTAEMWGESGFVLRVSAHGLRRTAGARWLAAGVPILLVSRWLGHASVVTTERHCVGICEATHVAYIERMDAAG